MIDMEKKIIKEFDFFGSNLLINANQMDKNSGDSFNLFNN